MNRKKLSKEHSKNALSLATSLTIHVCILLIAVGVFQSPDEYVVEELESVPVDIVSLEEFSKRQATQKDAPPPEPEKKIAPKVKVEPEIKEIIAYEFEHLAEFCDNLAKGLITVN